MLRACLFPASVLTVIALLVTSCPVALVRPAAARPAAQPPDGVVISQVFAGGGGNDAPFRSEYVELFNAGDASVDLAGWSVQDASARGATWTVTPLTGSIAPGGYFLVVGPAAVWGAALPTPDIVGSFELGTSGGKVALVEDTTPLTCGTAPDCAGATGIQDLVGYGRGASAYEGTGPAPAPGGVRAVVRLRGGCADHDDNARDLDAGIAAPRTSADPSHPCGPAPAPDCSATRIHAIQGAGHRSPAEGCALTGIEGVVTGLLGNGFYMEDPTPDADPATSEGLLVFLAAAPAVKVNNLVRVTGTVAEFRPGFDAGITNLTTTELVAAPAGVTVVSGTPPVLPAPIVLGVDRLPPTTAWSTGGAGDVERAGTFDPDNAGLDFYESLEGMRVRLDGALVLGVAGDGPIPVLAGDGSGATGLGPRDALVGTVADANPERLVLDGALLTGGLPASVEVGDQIPGPLNGIVHYDRGRWVLRLTARPHGPLDTANTPEQTAPAGPGELAVATVNVENLAFDDPALTASQEQTKFAAVAREVVEGLGAPDLIVLQEMQDDNGAAPKSDDPDGVLSALQTADRLIAAIVAAGGPAYTYQDVPPAAVDADGGQPRGNIRIAFLFRTDRGLALVDRGGAGGPHDAVAVAGAPGAPALSANPARIEPDALAFEGSRKPLVGEFLVAGRTLFVVGNHFSSKAGSEPAAGRFRPPHEEGEQARAMQAEAVAAFVGELLARDPNALVVVLGDFNDVPDSVALGTLTGAGLTNLVVDEIAAGDRYSSIFEGNAEQIDQILVSTALAALLVPGSVDVVHLNAEFAVRASDHDPVVVRFALGG